MPSSLRSGMRSGCDVALSFPFPSPKSHSHVSLARFPQMFAGARGSRGGGCGKVMEVGPGLQWVGKCGELALGAGVAGRKKGPIRGRRGWREAKPGGGAGRQAESTAGEGWGARSAEAARGLRQSCSKVPGPGSGPLVSSSAAYLRSGRRR